MSSIIFLGLSSSVGKSTIATICCRELANRGYNVTPFKAFNLSSICFNYNSYTIGYAQYIQSVAARREYDVKMNPVFKHFSNNTLSYVVLGKPHESINIKKQSDIAYDSYEQLVKDSDVVVCEGSGSFCELNLVEFDYANLSFAKKYNIPIIIVADISNGGIFGNLYGHISLLSESEKALVKGIVVNKFDGDIADFTSAKEIIENLCDTKVIGVVPNLEFDLPNEDGINTTQFDKSEVDKLVANGRSYIDFDYIESLVE